MAIFRHLILASGLLLLAACNTFSMPERHHSDAMGMFQYAAVDSNVYTEVLGNPGPGGQQAVTQMIIAELNDYWQFLRANFTTERPSPKDNPYKVVFLFNPRINLHSSEVCQAKPSDLLSDQGPRINIVTAFCGPQPIAEMSATVARPANVGDPAFREAIAFLAWHIVTKNLTDSHSCNQDSCD